MGNNPDVAYQRRELSPDEKRILGENLRAAREKRSDLKLGKDAAERIGVSPTQISLWEQGRTGVDLPRLLDVAAAYEVPLDDLVVGLNPDYDRIITKKLAPNVRRHFQAMIDGVLLRDVEMAEMVAGLKTEAGAPSAASRDDEMESTADKPAPTRARRKLKRKKTRRRRDDNSTS